jgi:lipopolysaccharide/colanic/teichoic acid biosynthesis glycosyltransferase
VKPNGRDYIFSAESYSISESKTHAMKKGVWRRFVDYAVETAALALFILLALLLVIIDRLRGYPKEPNAPTSTNL